MQILDDVKLYKDFKKLEKDSMIHCLTIVEDLFSNELSDDVIKIMSSGYDRDIDALLDDTVKEVYRILYGRVGEIKPNLKGVSEMDGFLEESMRKNDLCYFAQTCLSDFEINWHHVEWGLLINRFRFLSIIAARDHGKSYFFSLAYPIWRAYRYSRFSPNRYDRFGKLGYLFSMNSERASELLEIIKDEVEGNDYLRDRLYPDDKDNWSKRTLKFKTGAKLRARGFGSGVRGAHPGYIVCDDVVKDNVLYSEVQRERNKEYFDAVIMNMLIPKGQICVVGTPFHYKDLYSKFQPQTKEQEASFEKMYKENGWVFARYPAIDNDGKFLWTERYNHRELARKKKQLGNLVFSREMLCMPITSDSSLFPLRLLQKAFIGTEHYRLVGNVEAFGIKFKRVITGGDFAMSAEVGADYTTFTTWGEDDFRNRWLVNMFHEKGVGFYQQITALKTIGKMFRPDLMVLEENNFQAIYSEVMKFETSLPIKSYTTGRTKSNLYNGVPGMVLHFENNRIKLPRGDEYSINMTNKMVNEFNHIGFTDKGIQGIGEHDDIVMSTWLAMKGFDDYGNDMIVDIIQ